MSTAASAEASGSAGSDGGIPRAIRFAVYLTGALVTLAFGVLELAGALGQALECLAQTPYCPAGFSQASYLEVVPTLVGAAFLVAVAFVLFLLARGQR